MPYITCKDGNTYSRYDQSEYVQKCICEEYETQQREYNACTADPKCRAEREHSEKISGIIGYSGLVICITIFWYALYKMLESLE